MFYISIDEYLATMSDEEYLDIMLDAFADEIAEAEAETENN